MKLKAGQKYLFRIKQNPLCAHFPDAYTLKLVRGDIVELTYLEDIRYCDDFCLKYKMFEDGIGYNTIRYCDVELINHKFIPAEALLSISNSKSNSFVRFI